MRQAPVDARLAAAHRRLRHRALRVRRSACGRWRRRGQHAARQLQAAHAQRQPPRSTITARTAGSTATRPPEPGHRRPRRGGRAPVGIRRRGPTAVETAAALLTCRHSAALASVPATRIQTRRTAPRHTQAAIRERGCGWRSGTLGVTPCYTDCFMRRIRDWEEADTRWGAVLRWGQEQEPTWNSSAGTWERRIWDAWIGGQTFVHA